MQPLGRDEIQAADPRDLVLAPPDQHWRTQGRHHKWLDMRLGKWAHDTSGAVLAPCSSEQIQPGRRESAHASLRPTSSRGPGHLRPRGTRRQGEHLIELAQRIAPMTRPLARSLLNNACDLPTGW
jgi:hypothetical protein